MKTFIEFPIVWVFHGRYMSNKINHMHGRSLGLLNKDYKSSLSPSEEAAIQRCSYKFHKIHRKTPIPESLF